jgi:hypothetical protein
MTSNAEKMQKREITSGSKKRRRGKKRGMRRQEYKVEKRQGRKGKGET